MSSSDRSQNRQCPVPFLPVVLPTSQAVGTAISVVVFNYLIKMSGAIFAASCTYLIPVVAIGWGLFDGEVVNPLQIAAVFVIIGGIWLINTLKKD